MDSESRLRLQRDLPAVEAFLAETGGEVLRSDTDPDGWYWVRLCPRSGAAPFIARVIWTVYTGRPPPVLFALKIGGPIEAAGWPEAPGYRRGTDICKPFTAEGQAAHPEWANGVYAWRGQGNACLYVVEILQDDIDRVAGRRAAA